MSSLIEAAKVGEVLEVQRLISQAGEKDSDGMTALMHAANNGHFHCVCLLLPHEAKLCTPQGLYALHFAADNGHTDIVRVLIGVEAQVQTNDHWTPLMLAALKGHHECVSLLSFCESRIQDANGATALMRAACHGHLTSVNALLVEARDQTIQRWGDYPIGMSALMLAARWNHPEIVSVLLPYEYDLCDEAGHTALWHAEHPLDITGNPLKGDYSRCRALLQEYESNPTPMHAFPISSQSSNFAMSPPPPLSPDIILSLQKRLESCVKERDEALLMADMGKERVRHLRQKILELTQSTEKTRARLDRVRSENSLLTQEKERLRKTQSNATKELQLLRQRTTEVDALRLENQGLLQRIRDLQDAIQTQKKEAQKNHLCLEAQNKRLTQERDETTKKLKEKEDTISELNGKHITLSDLIATTQTQLESERRKSAALEASINRLDASRNGLNAELSEAKAQQDTLSKMVDENGALVKQLKAKNAHLVQEKAGMQSQLNKKGAEAAQLTECLQRLQNEYDTLKNNMNVLENKHTDLEACHKTTTNMLSDLNGQTALLEQVVANEQKKSEGLRKKCNNLQKRYEADIKEHEDRYNVVIAKNDELERQLEDQKAQCNALKESESDLSTMCNSLNRRLENAAKELTAHKKVKDSQEKEINELKADAVRLKRELKTFEELQGQIDTLRTEKDTLQNTLAYKEAEAESLNKNLRERETKIANLKSDMHLLQRKMTLQRDLVTSPQAQLTAMLRGKPQEIFENKQHSPQACGQDDSDISVDEALSQSPLTLSHTKKPFQEPQLKMIKQEPAHNLSRSSFGPKD
ncbi:Ankyrin repeat protein 3 [Giardia muris]|uniref:Ankyrin repeat protein 3 n=1 Tax=Giardia muris TaxID=5742 RepID=A0A4Z1SV88_GIAMU|nr:Ankyrin repeat protein 3 [Giardia muris]|eukprot:TNJ29802.1 Ankyrin repeat protein 3 [Giardia muris]